MRPADLDAFENAGFRARVEHAPCGLLSMSRDGSILGVNAALIALTGRNRQDLVGKGRFHDLLTPGGRIFYETHLAPLLEMQGFVREIALDVVRADGTRVPALVSASNRPTCGDGGEVIEVVVLDATERRTYEQELLVSRGRIERLQRLSSRLAAAFDLQAVTDAALDDVLTGSTADGAALLAHASPACTELSLLGVRGDSPSANDAWRSLDVARSPALLSAMRSVTPLFIEDDGIAAFDVPSLVTSASLTRLAVLPLVIQDRPIGLLCLASTQGPKFPAEERTFWLTVARACAQAVDRARLHQQAIDGERRMALLSSVSRALLDDLFSASERARLVVEMLVPQFADFATIELANDDCPPLAARHVDEDLLETLVELRRKSRQKAENPRSFARTRPTGASVHVAEVSEEALAEFDLDEEELVLVRRLDPRSFVGVPLLARGSEVGAMVLGHSSSGRRFAESEVSFFVDLADRVALALENARLYEQESGIAARLQMSLLPQPLPPDPRFRVTSRYRPASDALEIGGDWEDAFLVGENRLGVAVGDVVGHDESAALVMGRLSAALRALALDGGGPARTLDRLSRFATSIDGAECSTVAYAELELDTGVFTYACAGHMPPILQTPGQSSVPLWSGRSPALGIDLSSASTEATVGLPAGSAVLLFTDGLIERRDLPFDATLTSLLKRLDVLPPLATAGMVDTVLDTLVDEAPPHDDLCVVAVSLVASC